MNKLIQQRVIEYIQRIWREHNVNDEYIGIWLALHEPYEGEEPKTSVIKTWFVTNYEVREKKPIDFKVFMDSGIQPNNRFDISYANTAMVKDKDLVYIDFQLGKLFGRGYLFELSEADELVNASELWIS